MAVTTPGSQSGGKTIKKSLAHHFHNPIPSTGQPWAKPGQDEEKMHRKKLNANTLRFRVVFSAICSAASACLTGARAHSLLSFGETPKKRSQVVAASYIFAGAGMWRGGSLAGVFRRGVGEGAWEHLRNGLPDPASVHTVVVHPQNPALVLVGTQDG